MSKQSEVTREQLEEIVAEAVRDYMPGRAGSKLWTFSDGRVVGLDKTVLVREKVKLTNLKTNMVLKTKAAKSKSPPGSL